MKVAKSQKWHLFLFRPIAHKQIFYDIWGAIENVSGFNSVIFFNLYLDIVFLFNQAQHNETKHGWEDYSLWK